jgi:DNA-binding beta-propeller fold protein YncE
MGHMMHGDSSVSRVTDEALTEAARGAVILERRVSIERGPIGEIAAGSAYVVVANFGADSVSILDLAGQVLGDVSLAGEPSAVVVTEDRAYVATACPNHDAVSVIDLDTRTVIATFPVAFGVTALAASPDGKRVYAGRTADNGVDITVIDVVAERVGTIDVGHGPAAGLDALRVDPNGKRLYAAVTDASGSRLVILDTETSRVQRVVAVGSPIRDIAYAGGTVYVLTSDRAVGGAVHVIDLSANKLTDTVELGGAPTQLVMSPDQARAYIVDYDRVAVLCTLTLEIVDSLSVDARPSCVAPGCDGSQLYVADYSGVVNVFSVESTMDMLYSQFLATDPIALSVPRTLQPVTV